MEKSFPHDARPAMEAATFSATGPGEPFGQALERVWVRREVGGGGGKSACKYVDALNAEAILELSHRVGGLRTAKEPHAEDTRRAGKAAKCRRGGAGQGRRYQSSAPTTRSYTRNS